MSKLEDKLKEFAEKTKPKEEPQKEVQEESQEKPLNWSDAERRMTEIEAYQREFIGKEGFNPFIWLAKHLNPLKIKFQEGDRSPDLFKAILAIPHPQEPKVEILGIKSYKLQELLNKKGQIEHKE